MWLLTFGGVGFLFGERLDELAEAADQFGSALGWGAAALLTLYFTWKYVARQRVIRSIRMARINPDELQQLIVSGHSPVIIDARSRSALAAVPFVIQGARIATLETIDQGNADIPRSGEVVVYCSCPNEISSARLALKLRRLGIERVRPLAGGIEAWRALSFPVVPKQG
jgi:rhodanese-related sulfurtransferase